MGSSMAKRRAYAVTLPDWVFAVRRKRKNGTEAVYWYYQLRRGYPNHGPLTRIPGDPTRKEFWEAIDAILAPAAVATDNPRTINALITEYKAARDALPARDAPAEGSIRVYDLYLKRIQDRWDGLQADGLTPEAVRRFIDTYADRPVAGNLCLSILTTLLGWGAERGYGRVNPAREVSRFETDDDGAQPWPEDVWQAIVKDGPPIWQRTALLGRGTGQRTSDLIKLRPADWDGDGINHTIKKLRERPHWSPVDAEFAAIIRGWECPQMIPYLTRFNGKKHSSDSLRNAWQDWRATDQGKALGATDLTLHGLRALSVCDDRIKGRAHQVIAARKGMSLNQVMRYSRFVDQRLIAEERPVDNVVKISGPRVKTV